MVNTNFPTVKEASERLDGVERQRSWPVVPGCAACGLSGAPLMMRGEHGRAPSGQREAVAPDVGPRVAFLPRGLRP